MAKSKRYILYFLLALAASAFSQATPQRTAMSGIVVDAESGETLPFVQVYFLKPTTNKGMVASSIGTTSDLEGHFSISTTSGYTMLNFQMMGYKTTTITLRAGEERSGVTVKLEPDVYSLQDVIITPKNKKRDYRRRGNPAVELIKNVIANKNEHSVQTLDHYTAQSYTRVSFALDNIQVNWEKPFWKSFAFVQKYIDTTGVYPNVTVSIRENLTDEYYQRKPRKEKKILQKNRVFGVEDLISYGSLHENIKELFKDIDINHNSMNLLYNRFVSPLSSTVATTFYQYYIMDTIMVDGYPCIDLAFVPVNSESYGFTGHLYIVNDSTYRIKRYAINIPPEINLNFASNYTIEHNYVQLENGLWAPDRTTTYAKFYIFNKKKGMIARQTKIYTDWDLESPIPQDIFSSMTADEVETNDSMAVHYGAAAWDTLRPEPLTRYENSVYQLVQEVTAVPKLASAIAAVNAITTEFVATTPARDIDLSKFDFGPIYNFVSWNMLEGVRLGIGGASTAKLHDQFFFRAHTAFGLKDLRPKYNATFVYTFDKHKRQPYDGLRHHLQLSAQYDVEEPGQMTDVIRRDNILMSIPTSTPTLGFSQYVFHAKLEYMKEWKNMLSVKTYFDFSNNEAAGALQYNRVDYSMSDASGQYRSSLSPIGQYRNYEAMVELKYSPGSQLYIDRMGIESPFAMDKDAPTFQLTHYVGYLDDRHNGGKGYVYNRTEALVDKRFWFSAFGMLDVRLQGGYIWQQVPFTKLYIPKSSTSIFLAQRSFNLMKPMEFMMDYYVGLYATYYLKGLILNRIPGIKKLQLREVISFSAIYGGLTPKNNPYHAAAGNSGLYDLPHTAFTNGQDAQGDVNYIDGVAYMRDDFRSSSPMGQLPYMELTVGLENILKFIRIDYIRRLTYNDYELPYKVPQMDGAGNAVLDENGEPVMINVRRRMGAWGRNGVKLTVRFSF
jgi:hypothetical protein